MRLLLLWILLAAAGVLAAVTRLRVETDILAALPAATPEVEALRALRDHFESSHELIVAVEAASSDDADAAAKSALDALRANPTVGEARMLGITQDVDAAARPLAWALMNLPTARLQPLTDRLAGDVALDAHLAGVIETLASSPDVATVQRLGFDPLGLTSALGAEALSGALEAGDTAFDPGSSWRVLRVLPREPARDYKAAGAFVAEVRQSLALPGMKTGLTGEIAFMAEAGGSMERDLSSTISSSVAMIAMLFWVMYRRVAPLLWIVASLGIVLALTAGLGALVLGKISAMNLGFAAIVIGLVVDYGVLIHVERRAGEPAGLVRRRVARSILGAALTTAAVFLALTLSHFPGLRELGALVAIGVMVGAAVMLSLIPLGRSAPPGQAPPPAPHRGEVKHSPRRSMAFLGWALLVFAVVVLLWKGMPGFDGTSAPLRPRNSEAMATLERIEGGGGVSPRAPVLLTAPDLKTLRAHAAELSAEPRTWLPLPFLPDEEAQRANRPFIEAILQREGAIEKQTVDAGFTPDSLALFRAVAGALKDALAKPWPLALADAPGAELLSRFVSMPAPGGGASAGEPALLGWTTAAEIAPAPGLHVPRWERLGPALSEIARADALGKMLPLCLILLVVLFAVLRRWQDMLLGVASLAAGFLIWFALMSLTGQTWNLASIAAIPLLLGTGIDYSIHMLLALQREKGDAAAARAVTGRAIIFCALSTCMGFGSLLLATNGALRSLGGACATGLAVMMVVSVGLLPGWRRN